MNTPRIETERLILRRFEERDIAALFELLSDSSNVPHVSDEF